MATLSHSAAMTGSASQSRTQLNVDMKPTQLHEDEINILYGLIEAISTLIKWVKLLIINHPSLRIDLYEIAVKTSCALEALHPGGKILQGVGILFCSLAYFR